SRRWARRETAKSFGSFRLSTRPRRPSGDRVSPRSRALFRPTRSAAICSDFLQAEVFPTSVDVTDPPFSRPKTHPSLWSSLELQSLTGPRPRPRLSDVVARQLLSLLQTAVAGRCEFVFVERLQRLEMVIAVHHEELAGDALSQAGRAGGQARNVARHGAVAHGGTPVEHVEGRERGGHAGGTFG